MKKIPLRFTTLLIKCLSIIVLDMLDQSSCRKRALIGSGIPTTLCMFNLNTIHFDVDYNSKILRAEPTGVQQLVNKDVS